jgi:hypothetical protein
MPKKANTKNLRLTAIHKMSVFSGTNMTASSGFLLLTVIKANSANSGIQQEFREFRVRNSGNSGSGLPFPIFKSTSTPGCARLLATPFQGKKPMLNLVNMAQAAIIFIVISTETS